MRLRFAELVDSVKGSVDYVLGVRGDGQSASKKKATLFSWPGIFTRPRDADDTTGTEDMIAIESGDERLVIGSHNPTAWERLISALGRELDKGEIVLTSEDGTARGLIQIRPNGDIGISSGDGGSNGLVISMDASTGDMRIQVTGDVEIVPGTTNKVYVGSTSGDAANEELVMYGPMKTAYDAHTHPIAGPTTTGPPTPLLVSAVASTKSETK